MWDLSSPARHRTHVSCIGRQILNQWSSREVPHHSSLETSISPSLLHFPINIYIFSDISCLKIHESLSWFSVSQFSCSVVSDSLQPHESQYARPPCPSPTPRVHSDSPDSTFLLISTLFLSFHHRQISWNMSLFPILPSILSSPSLSWQLLRHCSRAVSCSQISWSYLCYLCIWCLSITGQLPVSLDHYLPLALVTCTF